jgi:hypothetical protein
VILPAANDIFVTDILPAILHAYTACEVPAGNLGVQPMEITSNFEKIKTMYRSMNFTPRIRVRGTRVTYDPTCKIHVGSLLVITQDGTGLTYHVAYEHVRVATVSLYKTILFISTILMVDLICF